MAQNADAFAYSFHRRGGPQERGLRDASLCIELTEQHISAFNDKDPLGIEQTGCM